jgi:hypothetical protein
MATPFLAINHRSGTPRVKRYANATPGDPIIGEVDVTGAAADTNTATNHPLAINRVIQFGGARTWLVAQGTAIFRTTDAGLTWASVHSFTSMVGDSVQKTGIHIIDVGGVPTMVVFYRDSVGAFRASKSTNGTSWTALGPFALSASGTTAAFSDEVVYNNVLYILKTNNNATATIAYFFGPGTGAAGDLVLPGGSIAFQGSTFAIYRGSIYVLVRVAAVGVNLYDITTGVSVLAVSLFVGSPATPLVGARYANSFVDPATGDLICIFYTTTLLGWQVWRVSPALSPTNITGATLPVGLTGTTGGGNSPAGSRIRTFVDQEASPGANPSIFLYYAADGAPGTGMVMYQWQGVASPLTIVDTGGNTSDALGINADMDGGQYSWSAGEKTMSDVSWVAAVGGVRFSFKLNSDSGTAPVKLRAFTRRTATEFRTKTPAEVENNSHGALSAAAPGNYNTGLTADGTTSYQLTVNLIDLGFSLVERGRIIFDVVDDV